MIQLHQLFCGRLAVPLAGLLLACGGSPAPGDPDSTDATVRGDASSDAMVLPDTNAGDVGSADAKADANTELYCAEPEAKGSLSDLALDELSGLARSYAFPGEYWAVNDSGSPILYRVDATGDTQASWPIGGATHDDWEDVASYRAEGKAWIVIGDIGDNSARSGSGAPRENVQLFRFEEGTQAPSAEQVQTLSYTYPAGPRDAEALFVDPASQDIWIITKHNDSHKTEVYVWPYPQVSGEKPTLVRTLALGASPALVHAATSADLSDDRHRLWLRTYSAVLVWEIGDGESIETVLEREPVEMRAPFEVQGEAIVDYGRGFMTIAEGSAATVYQALCR